MKSDAIKNHTKKMRNATAMKITYPIVANEVKAAVRFHHLLFKNFDIICLTSFVTPS